MMKLNDSFSCGYPLPNPLPHAGEGANGSLCEF